MLSIIGTLKFPGFSGTSMATYHYFKNKNKLEAISIVMAIISFICLYRFEFAQCNAKTILWNLLFVILVFLIYTYFKKILVNFKSINYHKKPIFTILIVFRFYDDYCPGTGSLLIMAFIAILGLIFKCQYLCKIGQLKLTLVQITLFCVKKENHLDDCYSYGNFANVTGSWLGARLAIFKRQWIYSCFLLIVGLALPLFWIWCVFSKKKNNLVGASYLTFGEIHKFIYFFFLQILKKDRNNAKYHNCHG